MNIRGEFILVLSGVFGLLVLSSIVTWILRIRSARGQPEPKVVATIANLAARVKARLEMDGKEVGAMPEIEQQKNLRHILSRRARVAGGVGISSAECPAREAISVCPGPESCRASRGGKGEQMRQRRKRGAIRDNRRRWNAPKCGRLAVRESEIRHGEFCVD